jgi:hypothetical protein
MAKPPSPIHASTRERLAHQDRELDRRLYIHQPEFDKMFDRLTRIDAERRPPPREYHDDWKS